MKNVKIKVENEDQNLKVQERLCGLNWHDFLLNLVKIGNQ